jgi:hypothetical protein
MKKGKKERLTQVLFSFFGLALPGARSVPGLDALIFVFAGEPGGAVHMVFHNVGEHAALFAFRYAQSTS